MSAKEWFRTRTKNSLWFTEKTTHITRERSSSIYQAQVDELEKQNAAAAFSHFKYGVILET